MKSFFALILVSVSCATASAADCVTADGVTISNGSSVAMHYRAQPRKQVGPNFDCASVARTRTCVNGQLSVIPRECSQYDSGACVDSWIEMLQDTDFTFARCED